MAVTKKAAAGAAKKSVNPEVKQAQVKTTLIKKDVLVIRNVICKYGNFEAGKIYSVDAATENKLRHLDAVK